MNTDSLASWFGRAQQGDRAAQNAVYSMAFCRLRSIASALLQRERAGHTLQPTALVSELFLKLRRLETRISSEDHFFRISARAMRQVLIDSARAKSNGTHIPPALIQELLPGVARANGDPDLHLAVKMVFERLRAVDPKAAATVWLRSVEGLTLEEVRRRQGRKMWRVRSDFEFGLQWMHDRLKSHGS
jgi:RNA polymerase sigma factor (TIGR02999 family)